MRSTFVPLLETSDPTGFDRAKASLDRAGIPCYGEPESGNPPTDTDGFVLFVARERVDEARDLLREHSIAERPPSTAVRRLAFVILLAGAVIGLLEWLR